MYLKQIKTCTYTVLLTFIFSTNSLAKSNGSSSYLEDEITGVLIDRTITLTGFNIYRALGQHWRVNDYKTLKNLVIFERPSARSGSLIWVEVDSKTVFRQHVNLRRVNINNWVGQASEKINKRLLKMKLEQLIPDSFDIDSNGF